ncbi:MAG: UDP-N-acetylmuramoyl-L-alanine--D-glutamate ligase [Dehalococcoidia bacterium]
MTAPTTSNGRNGRAPDVRGKQVLVYSLGLEGRDLARWLMANGARVTMSDTRDTAALAAAAASPPPGVERVVVGEPLVDPAGFDLVAIAQSVLRHDPAVVRARQLGIPVVSHMQLFLQVCPGRVVGISGSSGKTTTTALVGAMAAEAGLRHLVGGNIGEPLLSRLEEVDEGTTVILEISHTQLQFTDKSPAIAAITNITPNHLDQFGWDEYVGLKRNLLAFQSNGDIAVLNADDSTSRVLMAAVPGTLARTSLLGDPGGDGAWLEPGEVVGRIDGQTRRLLRPEVIHLRGQHNTANVVMAAAVAAFAGIAPPAIERAVADFRGVPHRLEPVGSAHGVSYVNDSIATSPERTAAALRSFDDRIVLLLGGREKHLPLEALADLVRQRCRAVVCFGEAAGLFAASMAGAGVDVQRVGGLEQAVSAAARLARSGDVVLLSPAGNSFDAYPNFEGRGEAFRALVRALPGFQEVQP